MLINCHVIFKGECGFSATKALLGTTINRNHVTACVTLSLRGLSGSVDTAHSLALMFFLECKVISRSCLGVVDPSDYAISLGSSEHGGDV